MSKNDLPSEIFLYDLPLKRELDTFQYDVATYCSCMKSVLGNVFPNYLSSLKDEIWKYASQKKLVRPTKYSNNIRIYIFDQRLRIPLVIEDTRGDVANYCWKLAKKCRTLDDYVYGDGEKFDIFTLHGKRDTPLVKQFNKRYGFIPIEELALPSLVIFYKSKLDERLALSPWLVSFLLMKYQKENLVNWDEILDASCYCFE